MKKMDKIFYTTMGTYFGIALTSVVILVTCFIVSV